MTSLGRTVDKLWDGIKQGKSKIGPMSLADPSDFPCRVAGEVQDFVPDDYMDRKEILRMARFSQLAVAAASNAIKDSLLNLDKEDLTRVGVLLGTGNGAFPETELGARTIIEKQRRLSPYFIPMILPNMSTANISRRYGARGYTGTVVTACAASNQAMGEAAEVIRRGVADVIISGGAEAPISKLGLAGFCAMKALTEQNEFPASASRPFDKTRDGFVPAEGAGIVILESLEHALARNAPILAEIAGYGISSDAYHLVQPDAHGTGAAIAMDFALKSAGVAASDIDVINAHATSTPLNDASETMAIKAVFGDLAYKIPVIATKSMLGHALGASGAIEAIISIKMMQDNILHPTINYTHPDPECDLDYVPNEARKQNISTVLSNSFGFGGQNASLVLKQYED